MTEPQHMISLHKANKVRLDRAKLKRDIRTNDRALLRALEDPPSCIDNASIAELLSSQNRWAETRTRKFLYASTAGVTETRKIKDITARQRRIICEDLERLRG